MKTVITADWHFGYPGRLDDLKSSFRAMVSFCEKHDIKIILLLGDLVHSREKLTHDVSNAISILFDELNEKGIHLVALVGNHDMFMRHKWSINAIRPFAKQITYIDGISHFTLGDRKFWVIPFIEHEHSYMRAVTAVSKLADKEDILLTHIGIASAAMNTCFLVQNWSVVSFEETVFSRVYSGHFHLHQKVGTKSWYPGSPIPFRFDEGLVEHGFLVYDTDKNKHVFIDLDKLHTDETRPPDFITIDSEDVDGVVDGAKNNMFKIQLKEGDDREEIASKLKAAGAHNVVFVKPPEESPDFKKAEDFKRTGNVFESWVKHDDPDHLNTKLLLALEKEIRSTAKSSEDYD